MKLFEIIDKIYGRKNIDIDISTFDQCKRENEHCIWHGKACDLPENYGNYERFKIESFDGKLLCVLFEGVCVYDIHYLIKGENTERVFRITSDPSEVELAFRECRDDGSYLEFLAEPDGEIEILYWDFCEFDFAANNY